MYNLGQAAFDFSDTTWPFTEFLHYKVLEICLLSIRVLERLEWVILSP